MYCISMSTIKDIDVTLGDIVALNKHYSNRLDHFERIRTPKKTDVDELSDVAMNSQDIFVMKKQLCRSLIKLLPEDLQPKYAERLADAQVQYRECVTRKKELFAKCDRKLLFSEASLVGVPKTNDDYLDQAITIEKKNCKELEKGLQTVHTTIPIATDIGTQVVENHEKIVRINEGLDEVESELSIARKRITVFGKRLATDKVLIMFAVLLILGIVGIIAYAVSTPGQKTFKVPDILPSPSPSPT